MIYFVYFIQAGLAGPIKIGVSWNIPSRLYALQQASHEELHHIGDLHCTNKAAALVAERALHEQLQNTHIRGEWFESTAEVRATVPAACPSGSACFTPPPVEDKTAVLAFSLPRGKRLLDWESEYPPWADHIDRQNLSPLSSQERLRLLAQARRSCGSGRVTGG